MFDSYICLARVTISGKAKIGTMDGHFARDQIYGLIFFFLTKSGRSNSALHLIFDGEHQLQKRRKIKKRGDVQKKKKKKKDFCEEPCLVIF